MRRRTFLAMQGVGLLAATTSGTRSLSADEQAASQIKFDSVDALVLSPEEQREVVSFFEPGDYKFDRVFLLEAVYPRGTREIGHVRIGSWNLGVGVTAVFEANIEGDPDRPARRAVVDMFADLEDHFVTSIRSSYGAHTKSYLVESDGTSVEFMGHGISGIVGKHRRTRGTISRTDSGYMARRWVRENSEEPWTLIAEATWTRQG